MSKFSVRQIIITASLITIFSAFLIFVSLSAHSQTAQHVPEPYLLADIHGNANSYPTDFTNADGTVFMFASDENGRGLFINNGPQDGAHFVAEVNPDDNVSNPPPMPTPYSTPAANFGKPTAVNDKFFYVNNNEQTGQELWVSDGSPPGTTIVQDIVPGGNDSDPGSLTTFNDMLLFQASNTVNGSKLWITNGTEANTQTIFNNDPSSDYSYPHNLVVHNELAYFRANHSTLGDSIWRSDGTTTGTWMAVDILPGDNDTSFYDDYLISTDDLLYFVKYHPTYGKEFWRSDGTPAGTWLLKDINPGALNSFSWRMQYIEFEGNFYFYVSNLDYGGELWRTDGSSINTVILKDINAGAVSSNISRLSAVNGRLFFAATDGTHGQELWVSDGTANGTTMVVDINPTGDSIRDPWQVIQDFATMNDLFFFAADDGVHGTELWQSDGTEAGTIMVMDINPGAASSYPTHFSVINNTLYFAADDGEHGIEPWALSHVAFARDDSAVTEMGQPITINILENDNYLNLDQLIITEAASPQHGDLLLHNAAFIYTPDFEFIGTDRFTYTISDGSGEPDTATVDIEIVGSFLYLPVIHNQIKQ
jgi:ELWxxDGT repeat protein